MTPTPTYIPAEQLEPGKNYSARVVDCSDREPVEICENLSDLFLVGSFDAVPIIRFTDFLPLDLTASVPELRERIEELEKLLRESSKAIDELSLSPLDLAVRFGPEYGPLDANELNDLQEEIIDALAASREGGK